MAFKGLVIVSSGGLTHGGGIGSVTRLIKSWLNSHDPSVRVNVLDARGEARGGALWSLIRVPVAVLQLIYLRLFRRASILHLQVSERLSFPRKGIFLALGRGLGMRTVLHHHGAELREGFEAASLSRKRLIRWMVRRADLNIVLGEAHRDYLVAHIGAPQERVVVLYNAGQDLLDAGPNEVIDPWRFLMAANLSPRKGISELLLAVRDLSEAGVPVTLTVAGAGQVARYRAEARALGIERVCRFTGWILGEELEALFRSHSALVLPSFLEGLPIAIIEALSVRMPVIATPVGSIPEVLEDGKNCIFVEPGNVGQITEALKKIATDQSLRQMLVANGRMLYESHFAIDPYMRKLVGLYKSLETERPGDSPSMRSA